MEIRFDKDADALYIQFQTGKVEETLKLRDGILIDIDKKGRLFGIEILDVTQRIPLKELGHLNINLPVHT